MRLGTIAYCLSNLRLRKKYIQYRMNNLPPAYNYEAVRNTRTGTVQYMKSSNVNTFLKNHTNFKRENESTIGPSVVMRKRRNTRKQRKSRKATRKNRRN